MQQQFDQPPKTKKYAKITLAKRIRLLELVDNAGLSIAKAAKKMGIKISTAKLIVKKYRTDGTYFEKSSDRRLRLGQQSKETQAQGLMLGAETKVEQTLNQLPLPLNYPFLQPPAVVCYYELNPIQSPYTLPSWNFWCPT